MDIGIDSFVSVLNYPENERKAMAPVAISELLDRIQLADSVGLDVFGIGEHHRQEFLDAAPPVLLAAAAARTKQIRLTSAVTVLSAADPVRVFQEFATLDLISLGRAEMVVGRGSFTESFPLFGLDLQDYDEVFAEKLELLLKIREHETITWQGKFRPALHDQPIHPRPLQDPIPIWLGVGGTPESFIRAGVLGLPLMVAIIGGETHRFRPLIDLYRKAGAMSGHDPGKLKVGLHMFGYIATTTNQALEEFYPGYAVSMTRIGRERGWPPVTKEQFLAQTSARGAYMIGSPEAVADKIIQHSFALGGINRLTFQMDTGALPHDKLCRSIELMGNVKELVRQIE